MNSKPRLSAPWVETIYKPKHEQQSCCHLDSRILPRDDSLTRSTTTLKTEVAEDGNKVASTDRRLTGSAFGTSTSDRIALMRPENRHIQKLPTHAPTTNTKIYTQNIQDDYTKNEAECLVLTPPKGAVRDYSQGLSCPP